MFRRSFLAVATSFTKIADDIERRIRAGEWEPDQPLPTYIELCGQYQVGRTTISLAIALLKDRGVVYGQPGRAVFVAERD